MSGVTDQSQEQQPQPAPAAQAPEPSEAEALASAVAGYEKKTRGAEPPVDEVPTETPEPQASTPAAETPAAAAAPAPDPAPAQDKSPSITELSDELKALREKVKGMTGDADATRRMHGEIGNINRTLQQLQAQAKAKPDDAPANDELTAAITQAEEVANEYPELAGPLVKVIKSMQAQIAKQSTAQPESVDVSTLVSKEVLKFRAQDENDAIVALKADHPDYITVRETPEYRAWLASKTPEYQEMFNNTWNPAVVSKGLTEFKESLKAKAQKTKRLEGAITPAGVPHKPGPSVLPDEEGFNRGYYGRGQARR